MGALSYTCHVSFHSCCELCLDILQCLFVCVLDCSVPFMARFWTLSFGGIFGCGFWLASPAGQTPPPAVQPPQRLRHGRSPAPWCTHSGRVIGSVCGYLMSPLVVQNAAPHETGWKPARIQLAVARMLSCEPVSDQFCRAIVDHVDSVQVRKTARIYMQPGGLFRGVIGTRLKPV